MSKKQFFILVGLLNAALLGLMWFLAAYPFRQLDVKHALNGWFRVVESNFNYPLFGVALILVPAMSWLAYKIVFNDHEKGKALWRRFGLAFALSISVILFYLGITLPIFTGSLLGIVEEQHSVLSSLCKLLHEGEVFLGMIIILFTLIFPLVKYTVLYYALLAHSPNDKAVQLVSKLGKWSMLDVFVLALVIVQLKQSKGALVETMSAPGIICFGLGVLISMLVSWKIKDVSGKM